MKTPNKHQNICFTLITSAAVGIASFATPANAKDEKLPLILMPSSPWNLDYADDSCRLARIFGEGDDKVAFYIERYEPGDRFFLMVAGGPLDGSSRTNARFGFGPNGKEREGTGEMGSFGAYAPALFESNMALMPLSDDNDDYNALTSFDAEKTAADTDVLGQELSAAQEANIEWLEVQRRSKQPVRLALGPMGEPMAAMRTCTQQLLTDWGIDVEAHKGLTRRATPTRNPGRWMSSSDYPTGLLRKGMQGLVQVRLSVGTDGKPTQCHIQKSTRPQGFDDAVCDALMRKARFDPALDKDGKPLASYWRTSVRFDIPR